MRSIDELREEKLIAEKQQRYANAMLSDETLVTTIDLPRLQSLLAYLVVHHDIPLSRSRLAFLIWPNTTDTQTFSNLRTVVHLIHQVLTDADSPTCRQSLQ